MSGGENALQKADSRYSLQKEIMGLVEKNMILKIGKDMLVYIYGHGFCVVYANDCTGNRYREGKPD